MSKTPKEVLTAMRDFGVDIKTVNGWDRGRQPEWRGIINHHTATASASPSNPDPSLWWLLNAYDKPAANLLVGKTPGHTWFAGVDSYHCGLGGPWKAANIPAGNYPQYMLGIEIDDPGVRVGTLTDYQIENTAKINAAILDLFELPLDRVITHGCWTNGCHGVNPSGPNSTLGRKNDTIEGSWGQWPGDASPRPYNAPWWREQVGHYLSHQAETWDGTVPSRASARKAMDEGLKNKAAWRLACRLYDLGYRREEPKAIGKQNYPKSAVQAARESFGWMPGEGSPSEKLWKRIFGIDKP
jgi:hypothetical protein